MKISELISKLEELGKDHGDLDVFISHIFKKEGGHSRANELSVIIAHGKDEYSDWYEKTKVVAIA
jgi:hypothetical protein